MMEVSSQEYYERKKRSLSLPGIGMESNGEYGESDEGKLRRKSFVDKAADKCCGSTAICWWEPDMEDAHDTVDFSLETSLHGLKYICQPQRHMVERMFWLIAFIIGMFAAGWLISGIWISYYNSPVVVTFQPVETPIDQIPFPAITICNMNKVLKSKAKEYLLAAQGEDHKRKTIHARNNVYYMDHVCSASKSFSQKFNLSMGRGAIDPDILEMSKIRDGDDEQSDVARFLRIASQKCADMLLLCLWEDEATNCSKLFRPIETDFGKCCSFNMMPQTLLSRYLNDTREDPQEISEWSSWDYEADGFLAQTSGSVRTFPRRQRRAGKSSGLSVLLNPDLDEYFCTSSDSQGFRLVKHLPLDVPKVVDFGLAIQPNSEVFMGIRPEITMADPDIRNFRLEKRNCYFRGEFQLAYFNYYTVSNCFDECLANQTYSNCGCVRYYMPRDDTRDLCGTSKFECAEEVRSNFTDIGMSLQIAIKSSCDFCLPTCTEIEYVSETTVTPMQRSYQLWLNDKNSTASWARKNVSIVHIYFTSDSTYARTRKELYGIIDLIANTGGLLGLCLGFSGLSLIELLYFYTLRAWCRSRRRRSIWAIMGHKLHRMWLKAQAKDARFLTKDNGVLTDDIQRSSFKDKVSIGGGSIRSMRLRPEEAYQERRSSHLQSHQQDNPFIVVPQASKPAWGKFSGFGSQFSNT